MASHNPDPTSRHDGDQYDSLHDGETLHLSDCELPGDHEGACDQASLHAGGGREDPPARDTQGQAPFVVRVGVEAARHYASTRIFESDDDLIHRVTADHFLAYGLTIEQSERAAFELWLALRTLELHT